MEVYENFPLWFCEKLEEWEKYSRHLSFTDVNHRIHKEIVQMGMPMVPLLLRVLKYRKHPPNIFTMLAEITGANPVNPKDMGNKIRMKRAWVSWGEENGHIKK